MLSFKATFSLSSFTFLKRLLSSSSLSAIRVVSSAYLRLLIFLPATVVLDKTLDSPLDCKEIQPVHSEGDQPWGFFGRNDAKAETSTLATSCEELTHWKRLSCWERLRAGGEGDDRG